MLSRKNEHGIIKHEHIIHAHFFCAFPFVMYNTGIGEIIMPVTGQTYSIGKIDVLAIHEKCFVEKPGLIQSFFPEEHERAAQYIHLVCLFLIEIAEMILPEFLRLRKESGKTKDPVKCYERSGEPAFAF